MSDYPKNERLLNAAKSGSLDELKDALRAGAWPDAVDEDGNTALAHAALGCHRDLVEILIGSGANPCVRGSDCWTALHFAAREGDLYSVQLMTWQIGLFGWHDIHIKNIYGWTPTDTARKFGFEMVARWLETKGADLSKNYWADLRD